MKRTPFLVTALLTAAVSMLPGRAAAQETAKAPGYEFTLGLGVMQLDKDRTGIDDNTGVGLNMGIRFAAPNLPIGAEWRLHGGSFSLDDGEYTFDDDRLGSYSVYCDDCSYSIAGTDFSLLVNLNRKGVVNPYFGAGFLYERASIEADVYDGNYHGHHRRHYHEEWDEDGVTFLARAGLDIRADFLYARFDAGYIGKIYDTDEDNQVMLSGDLGFYLFPSVPSLRLDFFGHYFTEYKSFYAGVGLGVAL